MDSSSKSDNPPPADDDEQQFHDANGEQQRAEALDVQNISKSIIRVPPFWHDNPEIWFAQVESQFVVAKTNSDNARFNAVVASIESKVLCQVRDAVLNPPAVGKYANLKKAIIERYSDSAQSKIQKLLSEMALGDQKPSQMLAEMRQLGGTTVSDDLMKTLFLKNIPQQARAILATSDVGLTQLAALADKILEVSHSPSVQSIERPNCSSALEKQIAQLTRAVERLTTSRADDSSSSRSRSRSSTTKRPDARSSTPSNSNQQHEFCWYHFKFGSAATKCKPPCNYTPPKN